MIPPDRREGGSAVIRLGDLVMILDLHQQGLSVSAIARQLERDRKTVRKYIKRGLEPPGYGPRQPRSTVITPFETYLRERIAAFPELTGSRLLREIKELGYAGGYTAVKDFLRPIRPRALQAFERRFETPPGNDGGGGGRNAPADFRGQKRSNETHQSTTDPDARLYRKGPGMEARLCFIGHGLMENRSGLIVDARLTRVSGHAERLAALDMVQHVAGRPCAVTLGADRGYDTADFVEELRGMNVRPHVAQNTAGRRSAIDKRTTRHPGYAASQRIRKRIPKLAELPT
jgi:hypothetical protein